MSLVTVSAVVTEEEGNAVVVVEGVVEGDVADAAVGAGVV